MKLSNSNSKQFQAFYPKSKKFSNLENTELKIYNFFRFPAAVRTLPIDTEKQLWQKGHSCEVCVNSNFLGIQAESAMMTYMWIMI